MKISLFDEGVSQVSASIIYITDMLVFFMFHSAGSYGSVLASKAQTACFINKTQPTLDLECVHGAYYIFCLWDHAAYLFGLSN